MPLFADQTTGGGAGATACDRRLTRQLEAEREKSCSAFFFLQPIEPIVFRGPLATLTRQLEVERDRKTTGLC